MNGSSILHEKGLFQSIMLGMIAGHDFLGK